MATATPIPRTTQCPPMNRQRRTERERTRLQRAAVLYERRNPPARSDEYRWYRQYLLDEYPAYIG